MHHFSGFSRTHAILHDTKLLIGELRGAVGRGPQLAPGEPAAEQYSLGEVVLGRWRETVRRLNPAIPTVAGQLTRIACQFEHTSRER